MIDKVYTITDFVFENHTFWIQYPSLEEFTYNYFH